MSEEEASFLDNGLRLELLELLANMFRSRSSNNNDDPASDGQPKALAQRREPRFFGDSAPLALEEGHKSDQGRAKEARHPPAQFARVRTREEEERLLEEELRAEFVRVSTVNDPDVAHRFRKKTYATMPRPFECYSCMSTSYQPKWHFLQKMYIAPKAFSDACDEPIARSSQIPTILCASFCVSMLEANVEAGIFVGFKYIRGCGDRILRHGFNQTAAQIYRLNQVDKCRHLPRERLFNQPRQLEIAITGDLQLCTCYGDRCNSNSPNSATTKGFLLFCPNLIFLICLFILLLIRSY
ncbi:hypothetical protein niasHS_008642 [Heterodera schachtii]|uniref:Uncharacterized protein n=1 Tax=Heterodera schachtii TaxID=97005 RepID=A0ABD2JA15_HETSC